jgi:hypothetical protein
MGKRLRKSESLTTLMTLLAASIKKSRETMTPTRLASPGRISKKRDKVFAREKRFTKFDCILSYRDVNTILLPFYGMSLIQ